MDTWQRRMLVGACAAILTMTATAAARTQDADKGEVDATAPMEKTLAPSAPSSITSQPT